VTQQDWLPSLLGDWDKGIETVYGEEKTAVFCTEPTRAAKAEKNLLYRHGKPNKPRKGPLSLVLFESPFTSVSTVRASPSTIQ
jgi:hypothetical protein